MNKYNTLLSRREFLYLSGAFLGGFFLSACEGDNRRNIPLWVPPVANRYWDIFLTEADKYENFDARLSLVVGLFESGLYSQAESRSGAQGIMQIIPTTANELARKLGLGKTFNLYDPETNISMGVFYLNMLQEKFGSVKKAVWGYHDGPGNAEEGIMTENGEIHNDFIMGMYNDRDLSISPTYSKFLSALNNSGGLALKKAFEEQSLDYDKYILKTLNASENGESSGDAKRCDVIKDVNMEKLPDLIYPGDTIGGVKVKSGDTAGNIWSSLGKPNKIKICEKIP